MCLRHHPGEVSQEELNAHNLALAQRVNAGGRAYVTPAVVQGQTLIRVSIGVAASERADVQAVWNELQAAARDGQG